MDKSAIILAGNSSTRYNTGNAIFELEGATLLNHIVNVVKKVVDEVIVVANTEERSKAYRELVSAEVKFVIDPYGGERPLAGAVTGFKAAKGKYSLLLSVNNAFVSKEVVSLLFDCSVGKSATIIRFANGEIEPLHAVYNTLRALDAAKQALSTNEFDMLSMIERLRGVRYISTMVIEQLDPELKTFFNVNTPSDLKKAIAMNKSKVMRKKSNNLL